jgi:hypothetical protein
MIKNSIQRLDHLCETVPPLLEAIEDKQFSFKPSPAKWSKKEVIGHLIDSATNNHQRFVRTQFEDAPLIAYDQDKWNKFSYHQNMDGKSLIKFWAFYNKQLAAIMKQIPEENLTRKCLTGENNLVTLEFLINDYVVHLEHHLRQVVNYV